MSKDEAYYIPMPEEYSRRKLNALYREIPLKDTTSRLLRKYFNAAANLYGIIPLSKLYEIITFQNMMIACCNDGTRPVIFRIERIDIPENADEKDWLAKQNFKNKAEDAYTG